jgi:hypothetical protein
MIFFNPSTSRRFRHRPRGIAVVMILGLLAITIAISYATLRGQGTTSQLARNNSRALEARSASASGINAALRKISENGWGGVGVTLQSNVTPHSWYTVTFTTGDAKLTSTDASYSDYPFRLTIDSVGFATDPLNSAIQSQYKSRCVVSLQRKSLVAEPANWSSFTALNIYQYSSADAYVQFPVRTNGKVTLLGKLQLCSEYPGDSTARDKYLNGLQLRAATRGDYRPFGVGNLFLKGVATQQDATTIATLLTADLGTPAAEAVTTATPPSHPGTVLTYKLYPGGKDYSVPLLTSSLSNQTLAPDVMQNPLGIYRTSGTLTIQSNVNMTGTIITPGASGSDIQITGTGVVIKPYTLPALYGSNQSYQLPPLLAYSDVVVNKAANVQLTGATMCWNTFEVWNNDTTTATNLAFTGNLIANTFKQHGRSNWTQTGNQWKVDQLAFSGQLNGTTPIPYFPDYQQTQHGFTIQPTLTFSADSSGVKPHWHDWTQAVYQPDPADPGLRWEIVRWEENL